MSQNRVASRYAKSLLDLAIEQKVDDKVLADMKLLAKVGHENRDFALLLKNPVINHDKKLAVLKAIFEGKVDKMTIAIFDVIAKKHREAYLLSIADSYQHLYNERRGIISAEVTTTFPLNENLRKEFKTIVASISGKTVELSEKVDKDIIGGFVLRVGDRQLDDSVNSKLKGLRRQLGSNPYIKQI